MTRRIAHRTRGQGHGPIVRLMSPSDLGEELKPFVFLDLFEADMRALAGSMPVHPHSGIATVTVFADGDVTFDDPQAGHGILGYGACRVQHARAKVAQGILYSLGVEMIRGRSFNRCSARGQAATGMVQESRRFFRGIHHLELAHIEAVDPG